MINNYLRGRDCIEFVRGEFLNLSFSYLFCFGFELFYISFVILLGLPLFVLLLVLQFFLLLDDLFEHFLAFLSSSYAS
jgi:hypothetical protein